MSPPWKGCTPVEYTNYVASYEIYVAALNRAKAEFWKSALPASRGLPREVPVLAGDSVRNPAVYHVRTGDDAQTMLSLPTYAEAAAFASSFKGMDGPMPFVKIQPESEVAKIVSKHIPAKAVKLPAPPSRAQQEAKSARKTAARRRQRANRRSRDALAAAAKAKVNNDVNEAKLALLKSTLALDKFTLVIAKRKSKIPVLVKAGAPAPAKGAAAPRSAAQTSSVVRGLPVKRGTPS